MFNAYDDKSFFFEPYYGSNLSVSYDVYIGRYGDFGLFGVVGGSEGSVPVGGGVTGGVVGGVGLFCTYKEQNIKSERIEVVLFLICFLHKCN